MNDLDLEQSWHPASTVPHDRPVEVRVPDSHHPYILPFPCRRVAAGWINADMDVPLIIEPSHWREWKRI